MTSMIRQIGGDGRSAYQVAVDNGFSGTESEWLASLSEAAAEAAAEAVEATLTSRLSTEEITRATADTSLTSRLSTEEAARGSADTSIVTRFSTADTSLTTRLSTEEVARASADTSLATAVAGTYLQLAGGVMAGVLAFVAGTAALPGLPVASDLNTGVYGVSPDVLGVSAGGVMVQTWAPGIATVAGVVQPDADATRDLGTVSARWRDAYLSRKLAVGNSALGGNALDAFTASAGNLAVFQHNAVANGGNIVAITMGNALTGSAYGINLSGSSTGGLFHYVQQNGAGNAGFYALVTGAGDAVFRAEVNGVTSWAFGLDNSDSDSFKVSLGSVLGTNDRLTILTTGEVGIGITTPNRTLSVNGGIGLAETNGASVWHIQSVSGELFFTRSGSFNAWSITSAGVFKPGADNTYDLATTASRIRSGYFGTNVVIGNTSTSTAQLHVGAGAIMTVANGGGSNISPQAINAQTSGTAVIGVGVNDGTNNRRAGLFVNQTDGLWGLAGNVTTGAIPFIIFNNAAEQLRLDTSGRLGIGENSPNYLLDAKATSSGATVAGLRLNNNGTGANTRVSLVFQAAGTLYQSILGGYGASSPEMQFNQLVGATGFWTWNSSGTEVMRLTGGGALTATGNIRTTATSAVAYLDVATTTADNAYLRWITSNTARFVLGADASDGKFKVGTNNTFATTLLDVSNTGVATLYNNLLFSADATFDVAATAASRPRDIHLSRYLRAGTAVVTTATTVASLPAAATAGAGARAYVTDANSTTFLAAAVGGGANKVPVVSDGAAWYIG